MRLRTTLLLGLALFGMGSFTTRSIGRANDCNSNGGDDIADISSGASRDCNGNAVPDECELAGEGIALEAALSQDESSSSSVRFVDLDSDGDSDLVYANLDAWSIDILVNSDTGTFGAPQSIALSQKPYTLFPHDLNGDGAPDLLLILEGGGMGTLLNNGAGSFGPLATFSVGPGGSRLWSRVEEVAADLDDDGDLDVVGGNSLSNQVVTLLNQGDGTFGAPIGVEMQRPGPVVLVDLDGDGDTDVAAQELASREDSDQSVGILLNNGAGALVSTGEYAIGDLEGILIGADVESDGDIDILVPRRDPPGVALLRNQGNGALEAPQSLATGFPTGVVVSADLDGDDDLDLVAAGASQRLELDDVAVLLDDGAGNFAAPLTYRGSDDPSKITVADMNGDGRQDVLVIGYWSGDVTSFKGNGDGTLEPGVLVRVSVGGTNDLSLADVDDDGDLDVAVASLTLYDSLVLFENVSSDGFTRGCAEFVRGDVNSDGTVSLADIIMLRRFLFGGDGQIECLDAADASDNDDLTLCDAVTILNVLLRNPGWSATLPAPSPAPGLDPTPLGTTHVLDCDASNNTPVTVPFGCAASAVSPPNDTTDLLQLGDVSGVPGAMVQLPVYLSTSVLVDAVQLVVKFDPSVLEITPETALSFESTYFELFESQPFHLASVDGTAGILVAGLAGDLIQSGREIAPGEDMLIAWLNVRVRDDATSQHVPVDLFNGLNEDGVGPLHLRNELTHRGQTRFASLLPRRSGAILSIVGDQTLFVRGDSNGDQNVDLSDAVRTLGALFFERITLSCEDAADANDDGAINISDPIFLLDSLFRGGRTILAPFPDSGTDPTVDSLYCFDSASEG